MSKKRKLETALQIYESEDFGKIRTAGTPDNPLFCLADVCRALELDASAVMRRLEDGVISSHPIIDKLGRTQKANFVNEDGLYDVILDSRKPEAKKFRKWITSEVLPAIRKTGAYFTDKAYQKWLETREHGKDTRKKAAAVYYDFANYAQYQGDTREIGHIIAEVTIPCNLAVGLPQKNGRDSASIHQLNCLDLIEGSIQKVINDGMANGLHYTQIQAQARQWIDKFMALTFQNTRLLN